MKEYAQGPDYGHSVTLLSGLFNVSFPADSAVHIFD